MIVRLLLPLSLSILFSWGVTLVAFADVAGSLTIAGNGTGTEDHRFPRPRLRKI